MTANKLFSLGVILFGCTFAFALEWDIDGDVLLTTQGEETLSDSISGTGSITKAGAGTLTLSGINTYSGGTTITAGALQGDARSLQGDIANNATIIFDQFSGREYSGVMSGNGPLIKVGAGTLTLSGINTRTGGVSINGGEIELSGSGTLGIDIALSITSGNLTLANDTGTKTIGPLNSSGMSGDINLNNNRLVITQSIEKTFLGVISGTGGITKAGEEKLILSGTNTYSGGTIVSAGILQGSATSLQGDIINNAEVVFDIEFIPIVNRYSGVMSGSGSLRKIGAGPLVLSGINTCTGGATINDGSIELLGSGTLGSVNDLAITSGSFVIVTNAGIKTIGSLSGGGSGINLNNNSLVITQSSEETFSGVISGTGSITKAGPSTIILSGTNTYSGGTTVSAGSLQGNTASLQGDITNNAEVAFNQATAGEYSGVISGTGSLTKIGEGTVTLSGVNTCSGGVTINGGSIELSGSGTLGTLNDLAITSGSLVIASDAGTKTIGNVRGGGSITLNNNGLVITQSSEETFSGVISGSGTITKAGAERLILTGINTCSGGVTINGGSIELSGSGTLGTLNDLAISSGSLVIASDAGTKTIGNVRGGGSIALNNNGLVVTQSSEETFSGVISGSGTITKAGAEKLILSGINTCSGGVTINGGSIELSGSGTLGTLNDLAISSGSLILASDAGTKTIGNVGGGGGITLNNNRLVITQSSEETFSGVISGSGTITKAGVEKLILSGINTCSGGVTINGGSIELSGSGTLGTLNDLAIYSGSLVIASNAGTKTIGNVHGGGGINLNNNELVVTQSIEGTFSGIISGSGTITKAGAEKLTLSGANTFSGGITVSAGTLQGNTASLQGSIANNGLVIFDQVTTGEYSSVISGSGALTKSSDGKVILSGSNTYTGITIVLGGELQVTGLLASAPTVGVSGTLSGTGTVGTTENSGIVRPGASIGTLTINGDYTQDAGATLVIEINSSGNSDLLDVSDTAILAGIVQIAPESGVYHKGTTYTILTANSISGTFDSLIENAAFAFELGYSSTAVTLSVIQSGTVLPVSIAQLHGNAKRVANYLFRDPISYTGDLLTVVESLVALPASEFPKALEQLTPAQFGALPLVNLENDVRMAQTFVETAQRHTRCNPERKTTLWIEPIGYYYRQGGIQQQLPFQAYTAGGTVGASTTFGNNFVFSSGGGYSHSQLHWKKHAGKGTWDTLYLCPSFGWIPRNFYANGLALFAANFYTIDRKISFPNVQQAAHNSHVSYDLLLQGDIGGRLINAKNFFLQPEFSLSYLNIFEEGYVEKGAKSINLQVHKKHSAFLRPEFVIKGVTEIITETKCISPCIYIGWLSNIPLRNKRYTAKFYRQTVCMPDFRAHSFHKVVNVLTAGGEITISTAKGSLALQYEANFGKEYQVQEGKVRFEWAF